MLNKSLFTAIKRSTGNTGGCGCAPSAEYNPLYNGNISAMSVNIGKLNNPLLYNYQYDQLNRLVAMDAFTGLDSSNNTWNTLTTDNSYQERVSYDANGNIQTYFRNGTTAGGTPETPEANQQWIKNKLARGFSVIDLGLEPKYENEGNTDKGKFYSGETEAVEKTNIVPESIKIKKD